ncbi:MAG: L,D-transpeptidase [Clostridiales bacterium]|nr:L,D-transpeptidase [Clostridiales bacterium]
MLRTIQRKTALLLTALLLLSLLPTASLATSSSKNVNNLPVGTTEGYESGANWFGEDFSYDVTDEETMWELLTRPITVLDIGGDAPEKTRVYPLDSPGGEKVLYEFMGGSFFGNLGGVHVLGEDEDGYTLIEGIDDYDRLITGYVKTRLLKEVTPNQKYGIIIDKLTQRLYVYIDGKLWSSCAISTGLVNDAQPFNETATGEYLLGSWVGGFDSEGMYCDMAIRFNGGDLIHQVPYVTLGDGTKRFSKYEALLGQKASHGCVRTARIANEEGLCIRWLWENVKKKTKVLVWDDDGRTLPYPDDALDLYYNENGGSYYHSVADCNSVRDKYLPLTGFKYSELDTAAYADLERCPTCLPELRKSIIDKGNAARGTSSLASGTAASSTDATPTIPPSSIDGTMVISTDDDVHISISDDD